MYDYLLAFCIINLSSLFSTFTPTSTLGRRRTRASASNVKRSLLYGEPTEKQEKNQLTQSNVSSVSGSKTKILERPEILYQNPHLILFFFLQFF